MVQQVKSFFDGKMLLTVRMIYDAKKKEKYGQGNWADFVDPNPIWSIVFSGSA